MRSTLAQPFCYSGGADRLRAEARRERPGGWGRGDVIVYTSATKNYIPKARVLARTLKSFHPDWPFCLVLSDTLPDGFDIAAEPFDRILTIDQLGIPDWKGWAFGHSVVELCTAVKGPAADLLARSGEADRILYLDPDIKVFAPLDNLDRLLDDHDILLTPHLLDFEQDPVAVRDNEICTLQHGVFNLGFFAARTSGQGAAFIDWWRRRLLDHCVADVANGLFTDQKWCDLAPAFFDRLHIVRDRGCNVATWNLAHRRITKDAAGKFLAGGAPLRFYHFTGFDSGDGRFMLDKYADDQEHAAELWTGYETDLEAAGHGDPALQHFAFGHFSNGEPIPLRARRFYRARADARAAYPDPFRIGGDCFYRFWRAEDRGRNRKGPIPAAGKPRSGSLRSFMSRAVRRVLP